MRLQPYRCACGKRPKVSHEAGNEWWKLRCQTPGCDFGPHVGGSTRRLTIKCWNDWAYRLAGYVLDDLAHGKEATDGPDDEREQINRKEETP